MCNAKHAYKSAYRKERQYFNNLINPLDYHDRYVDTLQEKQTRETYMFWDGMQNPWSNDRYFDAMIACYASKSIYTLKVRSMMLCQSCGAVSDELDHDTCPHCLLMASQALLNAANDTYEDIAKIWINTFVWRDDNYFEIQRLYDDASQHVQAMINLQDEYHVAYYNATGKES